jgi:hypothetical protein
LIYAQSGAGKTSILNAQVTRVLEENGFRVLPVARPGSFAATTSGSSNSEIIKRLGQWTFSKRSKGKTEMLEENLATGVEESNFYIYNAMSSMKSVIDPESLSNKSFSSFLKDFYRPTLSSDGIPLPQVVIFDPHEK